MSDLDQLIELVREHEIKRALIIDDAYDEIPFAEDLEISSIPLTAKSLFKGAATPVKTALAKILEEKGIDGDDYVEGLADDDFVEKLWRLAKSGKVNSALRKEIFGGFEATQASKKKQLEYLEGFLSSSKVEFISQGRRDSSSTDQFQIIFLDLYLGVTDNDTAIDGAVGRIQSMLEGKPDEQRPLIVVMSTTGNVRLYELASDLQRRAELLGCKFRAVNKEDFPSALPKALTDLLTHKHDAQLVAKWLDGWTNAVTAAASEYRRGMRLLDLSDLAYLSKFRLDAERTTLAEYLNSMSTTYVQFCVEKELAASASDRLLDGLKFEQLPALHFLPSEQIPRLKHASTFLNEAVISREGFQFEDPKSSLQLGDLIVEKPKLWHKTKKIEPDDMPVFVVISQACDIAQGKSDALLLLRGTIKKRDWTADIRVSGETTDVFLHEGRQFQIEWEKAQISAWTTAAVERRLNMNGKYLRIGRFRNLEALKLQQVFASNLTRVGTIAAPHPHTNVGLSLTAPTKDGKFQELFGFTPLQRMAAVMWVKPDKGALYQILVFNGEMAKRVVETIEGGLDLSQVKDPFAGQLKKLAASSNQLLAFEIAAKVSQGLDFGSGLKIETKWDKKLLENPEKDPRKTKLVMALTTAENSGT